MARSSAFSFSVAVALLTTGCDVPPEYIKIFNEKVGSVIGVQLAPTKPDAKPVKDVSTAKTAEAEPPTPDHRQVNAEFIKELFKVVLRRDVRSEEEFVKYMNVMDQGGHYEGIYNGLIYSAEYKDKEKGVAPISALKIYTDVMAQITLDQRYDPLKIVKPEKPDVPSQEGDLKPPQPTDAERAQLLNDIQKDAMTKSLFYLKRRLGEEVLKTIDLKKEYKEKFATWYGHFTVFLNKKGVDFGLPQRNKTNEYFHYKWALDAEEDRLKWETLNRVHVLMNVQAK